MNDSRVSSKAFHEGGYFFSRWNTKDKSVLIWDCGPIGYQANPYHAHLDALSFVLAIDGILYSSTRVLMKEKCDGVATCEERLHITR